MVVVCCVSAACGEEGLVNNTVEVALVVVSGMAVASSTTPDPLPKFPLSWLFVGDNGFVKNIVPVFGIVVVCCVSAAAACGEKGLVNNTVIVVVALVVVSGVAIAISTTPNPLPMFPLSWLLVGDNGFVKSIVPVFGMVVVCCVVSEGVVVSFVGELDIADACQGLVKYIVDVRFGGVCDFTIGKSK